MKLTAARTVMHLTPGSGVIRWARYIPTEHGVEQYIAEPDRGGDFQLRAQIEDAHWPAFCETEPSAAEAQRQDDAANAKAVGSE